MELIKCKYVLKIRSFIIKDILSTCKISNQNVSNKNTNKTVCFGIFTALFCMTPILEKIALFATLSIFSKDHDREF